MSIPSALLCLGALILPVSGLCASIIDVTPGPSSRIAEAVALARPGDVIRLQAGIYSGTVDISSSGEIDRPITIAGPSSGDRAIIDGGGSPAKGLDNQAFRISHAQWVVIRDVDAIHCWTNVIDIRDSSYLSIQSCRFLDCGMTAVAAHGSSHHILVEHCEWSQDERVFTTWDWTELHHGNLSFYNGGIFGGSGNGSGSVIRFNKVHNVFNGLRWWPSDETLAAGNSGSNIEIYGNEFWNCRDNVIEPERFTCNLHIYQNVMNSCPRGVLSIDGLRGGMIFVYGNTGTWRRNNAVEESPWTIFKFANYGRKDSLDQPLFIFHNSWAYDKPFVRGSKIRKANDHVIHFNNAYLHPGEKGNLGLVDWPGLFCEFDYDISSRPWSSDVERLGLEKHGIADTDPAFRDALQNDFRLAPQSPAIDKARIIDGFTLWYRGQAPDMGAFEGEQPVYGMPFVHVDPIGGSIYTERPRIVRIFSQGSRLAIFFSAPLDHRNLGSLKISASGTPLDIVDLTLPSPDLPQAIVVSLREPLPSSADLLDIQFTTPPAGRNALPSSIWAADTRIVRIPPDAALVGGMLRLFQDQPE